MAYFGPKKVQDFCHFFVVWQMTMEAVDHYFQEIIPIPLQLSLNVHCML